jgi:3-mercaptopyruvate sulfurtransferase SseA
VQETDVCCAVRGARVVLVDGGPTADGVRAPMTAHWLAQMGWDVAWLAEDPPAGASSGIAPGLEEGPWRPTRTQAPAVASVTSAELAHALNEGGTVLVDVQPSAHYVKGHIPGARWALRAQIGQWWPRLQADATPTQVIVTSEDGELAAWTAADLMRVAGVPVKVLAGGNAAWADEGRTLRTGDGEQLSPRIDRYRRPYEGTDAPREAMQGYLDWEFGLVEQLGRDGTHFFKVLPAA